MQSSIVPRWPCAVDGTSVKNPGTIMQSSFKHPLQLPFHHALTKQSERGNHFTCILLFEAGWKVYSRRKRSNLSTVSVQVWRSTCGGNGLAGLVFQRDVVRSQAHLQATVFQRDVVGSQAHLLTTFKKIKTNLHTFYSLFNILYASPFYNPTGWLGVKHQVTY